MNIYIDSTFDKYTKVAFIGWTTSDLLLSNTKRIHVEDINKAEMSALCFAVRERGVNNNFLTDSMSVVDQCACDNVSHVPRAMNIADSVVSISKEWYINNKRSK